MSLTFCRVMSSDLLTNIDSALGDGTDRLLALARDNRHGDTPSIRSYGTDSIGSFSASSAGEDDGTEIEQNGNLKNIFNFLANGYSRFGLLMSTLVSYMSHHH